jgi:hypothetical protein
MLPIRLLGLFQIHNYTRLYLITCLIDKFQYVYKTPIFVELKGLCGDGGRGRGTGTGDEGRGTRDEGRSRGEYYR